MLSRDLFHFAVTISFQQARARVRRNIVAFAGICGGIVLVLVQLGFQSALYESAVRMHRLLNWEVVVIAEEFRSIQNPTWLPREWLVLTLAHPAVAAVAPLYLAPVTVRMFYERLNRTFNLAKRERVFMGENPCRLVNAEILKNFPAWRPRG